MSSSSSEEEDDFGFTYVGAKNLETVRGWMDQSALVSGRTMAEAKPESSEDDWESELFKPRPAGLGIGAKYVPHSASSSAAAAGHAAKALKKRIEKAELAKKRAAAEAGTGGSDSDSGSDSDEESRSSSKFSSKRKPSTAATAAAPKRRTMHKQVSEKEKPSSSFPWLKASGPASASPAMSRRSVAGVQSSVAVQGRKRAANPFQTGKKKKRRKKKNGRGPGQQPG
jgi:hypothetical protein